MSTVPPDLILEFDILQNQIILVEGELAQFIDNRVGQAQASINQNITASTTDVLSAISVESQDTRSVVNARTADVLNAISDSTTIIDNRLSEIGTQVQGSIERGLQETAGQITSSLQAPLDAISSGVQGVRQQVSQAETLITSQIDVTGKNLKAEADQIDDAISLSVVPRLNALSSALNDLEAAGRDTGAAIREIGGLLGRAIIETGAESDKSSALQAIKFLLKEVFDIASPGPDLGKAIDEGFDRFLEATPAAKDSLLARLKGVKPSSVIANLALNLLAWISTGASVLSSGNQVFSQNLIQTLNKLERPTLLQAPDAVAAFLRGGLSIETLKETLARQGYNDTLIDAILLLRRNLLDKQEIVSLFLRDEIDEGAFVELLKQQGFFSDDIAKIKKLSQIIPPVQDLIVMAVREAFTPEIAEKFGQFENFPLPFKEFASRQGLSEEWAERYWAAHWDLPSPSMGFEMFQRRIITRDELDLLMRALDIMPFWRDRLVQLSFNPLTRVDIRRMHKVGVLNVDEVRNAYLDVGYSPENAQRLTDFTIKLNTGDDDETDPELAKLTRAAITKLYDDGVITRDEALKLLDEIGIGKIAANVFLTLVDVENQAQERRGERDLILAQFDSGQLTFAEAESRLASVGLETREQAKAVAQLVKRQSTRTKLPDKDDLTKMLKAGILSDQDFVTEIERLGFSRVWAERFLKLAKGVERAGPK